MKKGGYFSKWQIDIHSVGEIDICAASLCEISSVCMPDLEVQNGRESFF